MISQSYCQKQNIQITPQRIQLLNFFALNVLELEAQIKTELEENPFLESAIDENSLSIDNPEPEIPDCQDWEAYSEEMLDKQIEYQNYINKAVLPDRPLICHRDFKEDAKQQLRMLALDESLYDLTVYIIDTLNDHGLLDQPLCEVVESYSFHSLNWVDISKVEEALRIVQQLEPIGIGATSIRECLLMQLRKSCPKNEYADLAIRLIEDNYEELVKKQFEKICHKLNISDEILKGVFAYLRRFKLHPVCEMAYSNEAKQTLVPDFIITNHDNGISVELCSSKSHSLRLNSSLYTQVKETSSKKDKSAERYARNKIATAEWFIGNVKQREETMLKTMRIIVNFQYQFFRTGDVMSLKPMVLKDIADITGYDISILSRITTNKYADTHFGIIYLKDLFNEGIKDQSGAVVSNKVIQSLIKDAISGEDKNNPYTDQKLTILLAEMGYNVARRTVTKYREKLNIPIAQVRHVSARN